eukprot:6284693-Pyramimonas_sp.AAC.1
MNGTWSCRCRKGWGSAACAEPVMRYACAAAGGQYHSGDDVYVGVPLCQFFRSSCPAGWERAASWGTTTRYPAGSCTACCTEHTTFTDVDNERCIGSQNGMASTASVGCVQS